MDKLETHELEGVSETLLVPLHSRAEESRREANGFKDPIAEAFHEAISYDWEKLDEHPIQRVAIAARTRILDESVGNFIAENPDGLVVNLGSGLDTRFYRLDNGSIQWIEIDLTGVIAFRRKLLEPANSRHVLLAASVLTDDWLAETKKYKKNRVLFVAEGLFPYFTEEEHRAVFARLVENFPTQEMLFQTMAPSLVRGFIKQSVLSKMRSDVQIFWGFENSQSVSALNPRVKFVREFPILRWDEPSLPQEIREKLSPELLQRAAKIVHVRFGD
jgi:methyltransferase (TIGR00027 family)